MKTIEISITKNRKPRQILKIFRDRKLSRGDRLKIKQDTDERTFNALLVFILILVVWYFNNASKKKKSFGDEVEDMLFDKNISPETLEKQIGKEYGIEVEVEQPADEESRWGDLSAANFLKGYSENEPDYTEPM